MTCCSYQISPCLGIWIFRQILGWLLLVLPWRWKLYPSQLLASKYLVLGPLTMINCLHSGYLPFQHRQCSWSAVRSVWAHGHDGMARMRNCGCFAESALSASGGECLCSISCHRWRLAGWQWQSLGCGARRNCWWRAWEGEEHEIPAQHTGYKHPLCIAQVWLHQLPWSSLSCLVYMLLPFLCKPSQSLTGLNGYCI